MAGMPSKRYIIVNADDFGYYDCVSKGILDAANIGVVTATGIFANSPFLETHLHWLKQCDSLDTGVHLNLTDRLPLTSEMQARLQSWDGCFPGKYIMAKLILTGQLSGDLVAHELRAQIERCRAAGMKLIFLNSHEHIHMLPPVFRVTQDLAIEFGIPHIRYASPDSVSTLVPGSLVRNLALKILSKRNNRILNVPVIPFFGMAASGRLNLAYLRSALDRLPPGVHELMCHPGACSSNDVTNPAHRAYHDWKGEFDTLTSNEFRVLCDKYNIKLIGYRHTRISHRRIQVDIKTQLKTG